MKDRWLGALLAAIGLGALVALYACLGGGPARGRVPFEVTYYYLPGCMICANAKMKPAVSGLEKEFPGRVRAINADATTPQAQVAIKNAGFLNHGLLIRSSDGTVLWKQADHQVRIDDVREALRRLIDESG